MRHAKRPRRVSLLRGFAVALVAVFAYVSTAMAAAYYTLQGNIDSYDISALVQMPTPKPTHTAPSPTAPVDENAGQAVNLLLLGSDARDPANEETGDDWVEGMRNDTTLLMHISADRTRVDLVSIPRDSWVTIPECTFLDGSTSRSQTTKFNAAFSIGGRNGNVGEAAACTITTVQSLTDIPITGFIVVDFAGFAAMVDALGGVPMDIPNDMTSDDAGLYITAGHHVLDGETALAFARARKGPGLGDGSDIGRIARQQQLLAAIYQTAVSKNILTNLVELYSFLDAATQSLAASSNYSSVASLGGLAWSLRSVPPENIRFYTVPWTDFDGSSIKWTSAADAMWEAIRNDLPIPEDIEFTTPIAAEPTP
jgi:LCP family protein required for cell wall assembly